jgi:hypothetical protein
VAFPSAPLRNPQTFFTPKPLDLLVIHCPALPAGIVIRGPESATGMILGIVAKPGPQRGIGILGRGRDGFVALRSAVLHGHTAGKTVR